MADFVSQNVCKKPIEATGSAAPWQEERMREMGVSVRSNLACCTFLSITFLLPFLRITRSSLGRLNAAVCTP